MKKRRVLKNLGIAALVFTLLFCGVYKIFSVYADDTTSNPEVKYKIVEG